MGIDSVVCAVNAITEIIEQQAFMEGIATVLPSGEARVRIAEVPVNEGAPAAGKKLYEIELPKDVIIGCILRGTKSIIPRGGTQILAGDMLIVISSDNQEMEAIKVLTGQE
jgi:trk system potassium uptake protein TrkA